MKLELKRLAPLRTANIVALVYGVITIVVALLAAPIFLVLILAASSGGERATALVPLMIMLLCYPVFGLIAGWIAGLVGSAAYNFIVRWTGGMLVEFEQVGVQPGSGVP